MPPANARIRHAPLEATVMDRRARLVSSPSSGAAPRNRASRGTIAFLESDRPAGYGAGDTYGDQAHARPRVVLAATASAC